jgi:hypothetical protein
VRHLPLPRVLQQRDEARNGVGADGSTARAAASSPRRPCRRGARSQASTASRPVALTESFLYAVRVDRQLPVSKRRL